jgi:heme/copper-type cytochrome/quinol oxidase subunit 4
MTEAVQAEIDKYIKSQTDLFNSLKKSADQVPAPGKIEYEAPTSAETPAALNTNRLAQEKFLKQYQDHYNFITGMRQKYAADLDETNIILSEQTSELAELEAEKKRVSVGASTEYRRLKTEKYKQAKQDYYYDLYFVCGIVLLIVVAILWITTLGFIPRATALVLFLLAVVGLGAYVVYYIFFNSRSRDIMVFDRYQYPIDGTGDSCPRSSSEDSKKKANKDAKLDTKIVGILTDTAGQCPNKLVPDAEMPSLPTTSKV